MTVRLPQAYTDAKGNRVSGDYNLPAHSGMVFTICTPAGAVSLHLDT